MRTGIALLFLFIVTPALASANNCYHSTIGNSYTVLDASTIYMTQIVNGIFGKHSNHSKVYVAAGDIFRITEISESTSSYIAQIGYKEVSYMCSSLQSDLEFHNVIATDVLDKVKVNVGRDVWVTPEFDKFYTNSVTNENYRDWKAQLGHIESWEHGYGSDRNTKLFYYKIHLADGNNSYITVDDYKSAASDGRILTNPLEVSSAQAKFNFEEQQKVEAKRLDSERIAKEAKIAAEKVEKESLERDLEERAEVIATFKNAGVIEGNTYWLKYPGYRMPGLARLKIEKINVEFKTEKLFNWSSAPHRRREISMAVDTDYEGINHIEIQADPKEFAKNLYTKNIGQKWSKKIVAEIKNKKVSMGMTEKQVLASWGRPSDINRTAGAWGVHEQWVYSGSYLYFENGRLTSWQY